MAKMGHKPSLFRKMQEPYPSPEEAEKQLTAFVEEFTELREKYGVAQVLIVMQTNILYPPDPGEDEPFEGQVMSLVHMGDEAHAERLAAYALGRYQEMRQETMAKLMAGNTVTNKQVKRAFGKD